MQTKSLCCQTEYLSPSWMDAACCDCKLRSPSKITTNTLKDRLFFPFWLKSPSLKTIVVRQKENINIYQLETQEEDMQLLL